MLLSPSVGAVEPHRSMRTDAAMAPGIGTLLVDSPMGDHTPMPTGNNRKIDLMEMMNIGFACRRSWMEGYHGRVHAWTTGYTSETTFRMSFLISCLVAYRGKSWDDG
jgi:hypothetical protein